MLASRATYIGRVSLVLAFVFLGPRGRACLESTALVAQPGLLA